MRAFAERQAEAAESLRTRLAAEFGGRDRAERQALLRHEHNILTVWRYELARLTPVRLGAGLALDVDRFRVTLRDGGPNLDRIGAVGRLRAGATWDQATKTYRGGMETPASKIAMAYGEAARGRFMVEAPDSDVLQTTVTLADGRQVRGNRIVRGGVARQVADALIARTVARGRDGTRVDVSGEPMYVVTADPDDGDVLFTEALALLAGAAESDTTYLERVRAWQAARFLLFQAPRHKKGSDAVTRTFLVGVGAALLGVPPVLEQDVDLRCMVMGQVATSTMPADAALQPPMAV